MKLLRSIRLVAALALLSVPAAATTIVMPSDAQLVAKSPLVVIGRVTSSAAIERRGRIWTETALTVEDVLKGDEPRELTVREIGGRAGDRMTVIFGAPDFKTGERVLLFLTPTPRGDYQTTDLFVGKFTERFTRDGERLWFRADGESGARLLDPHFEELAPSRDRVQRRASGFEIFIRATARGERAAAEYFIVNPELKPSISSNFTLIDEPTIYRWFAFERGATVAWRSHGQQSGYSGGGVTELRTGMSSWSGYAGANIRYSYVGTTAAAGGLNTPNGVNEVLFNDPLNEVSGSWSAATGGVVGVGGFNSVSSAGSWTAPFTADSTHTARAYENVWNIAEGNLVIQDGVSASSGISAFVLAEILAHEFGHTLGFGHSATDTALMYFQVTGGGPSLRSDDQTAARWLYPGSSSGGGSAPSAPSNLAGSASGDTRIQLTWSDNASNETWQRIYMAVGTGSYSLFAEVPADAQLYLAQNLQRGRTYSFRVTAVNSAGESAPSNATAVTLPSDVPVAAFRVDPSNGVAGVTVFGFTDQSTGTITSRVWNFGDNSTSFEQHPTHVYAAPGTYSVTLTVSNGTVSSMAMKSIVVTTSTAPVAAAFSYLPTTPSVIDNIEFVDDSTGPVSAWEWDFGDSTAASTRNPVKRYSTAGTYNVKLTVAGNGLSSSTTRSVVVTTGSGGSQLVTADFEASITAPTTEQTIVFTDRSTGSPNSWYWSFGDGHSSTQQNPSHRFVTAGTYNVSMTSGNIGSSSTKVKQIVVTGPRATYRSFVPVAADTSGLGGSSWRTELAVHNARPSVTQVTLRYIPQSGMATKVATFSLAAGETKVFANALRDIFGVTNAGGAIGVEATNSSNDPLLNISTRTFTTSESGSYGQFVPDTAQKSGTALYLTGLQMSSEFRTNIGLVNSTIVPVSISMTLLDGDGVARGSKSLMLAADSFQQASLADLFGSASSAGTLSVKIAASVPDAVFAYASVVDNRSQDPVYLAAQPAATGNDLVIPAIARAPGVAGTFWRSDLTLYNPATSTIALDLTLLRSGADNRTAASKPLSIAAGASVLISDVISWFGETEGSGALLVKWRGVNGPIVTSRTFTERLSDNGSFGQSIDALRIASFGKAPSITGLRSDAAYRTNIGLVNSADARVSVTLRAFNTAGVEIAAATVPLQPKSQMQAAALALFGRSITELGTFTVRAEAETSIFAYGSVVDNNSGDPIFIAGR